jgi:hypothetical protein
MDIVELGKEVDDEVSRYFRSLGYTVTWDFNRQRAEKWYELLDGDRIVLQVDFNVPLACILEDILLMADGKPGTSNRDYTIACERDADLKEAVRRIRLHPRATT